jgi:hypothetical protein
MSEILKHKTQSAVLDANIPGEIGPTEWNEAHTFAGGGKGSILTRDPAESDGALWLGADVTGKVLISQGTNTTPAWSDTPTVASFSTGTLVVLGDTAIIGAPGERISRGVYAYKNADESVTNSTTLQNDDSITFSLFAPATYSFRIWIFLNNVGSTEGFKCALSGTVGVSFLKALFQIYDETTDTLAALARLSTLGSAVGAGLSSGSNGAIIAGTIETSTAGTLVLQWAQQTSGANATTVQRNTFGIAERIV